MKPFAVRYAVAAALFVVVDLIWLLGVANALYAELLGDLLAEDARPWAAVAFYLLFVAGLVFFVVQPAERHERPVRRAALTGAFFGLVTYATWDLTNLAVLADWPLAVVPIDLAWGSVLGATVCAGTVAVVGRISARRGPGGPRDAGAGRAGSHRAVRDR